MVGTRLVHYVRSPGQSGLLERLVRLSVHMTAMSMAWSFVFTGELYFEATGFSGQPIVRSVALACVMTMLSFVAVFILVYAVGDHHPAAARSLIIGFGLLVGLLWERSFHMALHNVVIYKLLDLPGIFT